VRGGSFERERKEYGVFMSEKESAEQGRLWGIAIPATRKASEKRKNYGGGKSFVQCSSGRSLTM